MPPGPESDSLLLDERLAGGDHAIPVPDLVPLKAAFAGVRAGKPISAFGIGDEQ